MNATNNTRTQAVTLANNGYSVRQIAEMLGVSEGTVFYHKKNERLGIAPQPKQTLREPDASAFAYITDTHTKVASMTAEGYSVRGIAKALDLSKSAVSYHRAKKTPVQLALGF